MGTEAGGRLLEWVEQAFPASGGRHRKTSDASPVYNCIAWAAGDATRWWQPSCPGYYWPGEQSLKIGALVAVFEALGYQECDDGTLERDVEKVALYVLSDNYTHAARQLPDGSWTSKLGMDEDICHDSPDALAGTDYSQVHCYMRRARTN